MKKRILITGASAGFGKLTTKTLLEQGHQVAASMRNVNGRNQEAGRELEEAGATIVEIDVTDEQSVNSGVSTAIEEMGGIDIVVNNAGLGVLGMQEHFTVEDFQKLFDVNVFGVQRINRAVLPTMRSNGSGLIVYATSLLGRITFPFYGPYNASKWALEAMAENYRTELSGFGIDSCIVEPGGYPTSFFGSLLQPSDQSRNEEYGEFMKVPQQSFEGFEQALAANPDQNPQDVADAILGLVEQPAGGRPFRTVVDRMGMGDPIKKYNEHLEEVMAGIYGAFGMEDMLKVKQLT